MEFETSESWVQSQQNLSDWLNLVKTQSDEIQIKTFLHNGRKLSKLVLQDKELYLKMTSYRGASAERVVAGIYRHVGIVAPDTAIVTFKDDCFVVTNNLFLPRDTEPGEPFLRKITPGGAQYVLPRIFNSEKTDQRILTYFTPKVLEQIALHYGLALATRNWDANLGNLGFYLKNGKTMQAVNLIAFDFEQSMGRDCGMGYANPFNSQRLSHVQVVDCFRNSHKSFIKQKEISQTIAKGLAQVDEIVYESQCQGFQPDKQYVEQLKSSMSDMANIFQR